MATFARNSKRNFFGSTLFVIFGIVVGIATLASIFFAFQQNTENRSKAATSARRVVKVWGFNGTTTEQWKKISGGGDLRASGGSLTFQLLHQGLVKVQNAERITFPQGTKYIRFAMSIQKPILSQPKLTQMCDPARPSCPSGYKCVQTGVIGVQNMQKGRCILIQPTLADSGVIPVTIKATIANPTGPTKPIVVVTKVVADGTVHTYDLKLTDQLPGFRLQDLIFEFTDVSNRSQRPQIVKIDQITLEVLSIPTPSVPKPTGCVPYPTAMCPSGTGGPCSVALENGVNYCPKPTTPPMQPTTPPLPPEPAIFCNFTINPPKLCPSGYDCVAISQMAGADGVCKQSVTIGPCWNQVFWSNNTYNWPNSCRGIKKVGTVCAQVITPLTSAEIVAFKNWNRQPIQGCQ